MKPDFIWPNNARCGVSLTYDDGLVSQLDNALPALREYGIKGTFFLSGAALTDAGLGNRWKQAVIDGHELGLHTIHHACDMKHEFVSEGYSLQDYDVKRMQAELEENKRILNSYGYTPKKHVFAYPCGESSFGPGMTQSYKPLIMQMCTAARGVMQELAVPGRLDMSEAPCFEAPVTVKGLIDIVEKAAAANSWAIILFHGVGGDYIPVSKETHAEFVKYLAKNKDCIHTACFGSIAGLIDMFCSRIYQTLVCGIESNAAD